MFVAKSVETEHKDLIHDVAYDHYGRRMATCSSDQSIKVWDIAEDGTSQQVAHWKAHSGSVWRVTWAHPEFGQVLATCSFDRTATIWEEVSAGGDPGQEHGGSSSESSSSSWVKRTSLVDSRTSVTDVKFAPKHLGLQLATCSSDGMVRIYEAPDVMNLSQWSPQLEINSKMSCSCIAWNPSRAHLPMIAVGSDDHSSAGNSKVQIYEFNENSRKWVKVEAIVGATDPVHDLAFAPNFGRSYHLLAIASRDVKIVSLKPVSPGKDASIANHAGNYSKFEIRQIASFNEHNSQVWRVSWNVTGTILASSGDDGCVRLWKANYMDTWKSIGMLKGDAPVASATLSGLSTSSQNASSTLNSFNVNANSGGSGGLGTVSHFGAKPLYNTLPTGI